MALRNCLLCLLLVLLFTSLRLSAGRDLHVYSTNTEIPKTVPFESRFERRSKDLPLDHQSIAKAAPGCGAPEQVGLPLVKRVGAAAAAAALMVRFFDLACSPPLSLERISSPQPFLS